jgi:hypothetical protein
VRVGSATSESHGLGVAIDKRGNAYVAGHFFAASASHLPAITFESANGSETTMLAREFGANTFLAKYARDGVVQWATQAGGADIASIAADWLGGIYISVRFWTRATFGEGPAQQVLLKDRSEGTALAKYSDDGTLVWVRQIASPTDGFNRTRGIAADWSGNSYVAGTFYREVTFAPGEGAETTLPDTGTPVGFIAKYDAHGAFVWARRIETTGVDGGPWEATVDVRGNVYVTGRFDGVATFGRGEPNETTLMETTEQIRGLAETGFVAKFDRHGSLMWARVDGGFGLAVDNSGNVIIAGYSSLPSVTFGLGEPHETTLISRGEDDTFVARYTETLRHRDVDAYPIVDESMFLSEFGVLHAGRRHTIIVATFRNEGSVAIKDPFVAVLELSGGEAELINGDGSPRGVGGTLTPYMSDGVLSPGEAMDITLIVRRQRPDPFVFLVNIRGEPVR